MLVFCDDMDGGGGEVVEVLNRDGRGFDCFYGWWKLLQ